MYITAASTISFQPTFRNNGFSSYLLDIESEASVISPDYTPDIPAMDRRRMSEILKMSISCTLDCLRQFEITQLDAIIVGTSMGCCTHTKNFLDKILSSEQSLLSPTSFILSTHNTIAGQISLQLKCHSYNMTHTHNSLSFEQALMDAVLCKNEGFENILVGAADELEEELYNMKAKLKNDDLISTYGASFFIISQKYTPSAVALVDVNCFGLISDIGNLVIEFLRSNDLEQDDIDLVLFSQSNQQSFEIISELFEIEKLFDFQKKSGTYFTNSAFALNFACDILKQEEAKFHGRKINRILILNNLIPNNLGLILVEKNNYELKR